MFFFVKISIILPSDAVYNLYFCIIWHPEIPDELDTLNNTTQIQLDSFDNLISFQ